MFKYKNWDDGSNKAVMGKTLNKAILSEVEIDICSIEEQRKIVNVLDKIMNLISARKKRIILFGHIYQSPICRDVW